MLVQCIHIKILPNQQQQRLIAKFKICSCLVGSTVLHLIVVPVKEFWLFGPWWIPKLRNQPVFGFNPKIPSVSCPLEFFHSVWRQTTQYFICSELSKFLFSTPRTESNQIFWWCSLAGCLCSESDTNPGMQRLSPVTKTTRISEW